jgi:hypothetical protein
MVVLRVQASGIEAKDRDRRAAPLLLAGGTVPAIAGRGWVQRDRYTSDQVRRESRPLDEKGPPVSENHEKYRDRM